MTYRIGGPAVISFSGGRTSGLMLYRILDAYGGSLPDDVIVLFANTGREMPQTLDFVRDCSERWNVPITWLEYQDAPRPANRWRVVTHATASRNGEPFAAVIGRRNFLPNPVMRFCTSELKVKAMHRYIAATRGWAAWTSVIGIRADEPVRIAKLAKPNRDRDTRVAPLAEAGISKHDVAAFWRAQPFDLALPNMNGTTMHGNCDLCFLKGANIIASLIREDPSRADWWIAQESRLLGKSKTPESALFRSDRPNYAAMKYVAQAQMGLLPEDDDISDMVCGVCVD